MINEVKKDNITYASIPEKLELCVGCQVMLIQNLDLHYFLENKGIRHMFFDGFYQSKEVDMFHNHDLSDNLKKSQTNIVDEFLNIREKIFKNISFRRFLMNDNDKFGDDLFQDFHPSEKAHQLWAEELYKDLK